MAAERFHDLPTRPLDPARAASTETPERSPCWRVGDRWDDRLTIRRLLGSGGMSETWSAWDERARRTVAVKTAVPGAVSDAALCAEALCLQRVRHPNLVAMHGVSIRGERAFVELELLGAQPVSEQVRAHGPLRLDLATSVITEVGGAVAALHRHGYAHRDVKPQNVLRAFDGRAVLVDLGLALHRRDVACDDRPALGTAAFLAPEVTLGEVRSFEGWCLADQYALAVSAYHLYTGAFPFEGASPSARLYAQCCRAPTPASSRRRAVPSGVDAVLAQALARHPADRFSSVGDFVALLGLAWELDPTVAHDDPGRSGVYSVDGVTRPLRRAAQ